MLDDKRAGRRLVVVRGAIALEVDRSVELLLAVRVRGRSTALDLGFEGLLGVLLDVEVDRQLDVLAGERLGSRDLAQHVAGGIDFELSSPRRTSKLLLEPLFDTRLADLVVHPVAGVEILAVLVASGVSLSSSGIAPR